MREEMLGDTGADTRTTLRARRCTSGVTRTCLWVWFKVRYDIKLAKYYCWAQTARFVYVSVFIPTGYADKQLNFQVRTRCTSLCTAWVGRAGVAGHVLPLLTRVSFEWRRWGRWCVCACPLAFRT